jgi:hypothetical protein
MRKIHLDLSALAVESFDIESANAGLGTVIGREETMLDPTCPECTGEPTRAPDETCVYTCREPECFILPATSFCPADTFGCPTAFC